jgi:pyruvate,water dikinase
MSILVPIARASERATHGGKGAHLAFMAGLGLRVPPGAVIPADAFDRHVAACRAGANGSLARAILEHPLEPELAAELRALVAELGGRVSVRSSATLEDARTHSFAGQFLTVLDVGPEGVEEAVRRVWASTFSESVTVYLRRAELAADALRMAVVVQRQIDSKASGVAMGDRKATIVEAVYGQGEALVSGEALADRWEVSSSKIASTKLAVKSTRRVLSAAPSGALVREDVPPAERSLSAISDAHVLEVADICAKIAEKQGRAQDCEFAVAGGELYLLQTRDVTASLPVTAPPLGAFEPPGPGAWELDVSHFQRPASRLFQEIFPSAMTKGFKKTSARYGALLSHFDYGFVNGFAYTRARPVAAPEGASGSPPPPRLIFWLLLRLVPELRRRVRTAETVWANREWRRELEAWKATKARAIEAHRRLQSVDLARLDDAALGAHFQATLAHVSAMIEQHHTHNLAALIPTGDFIAHVRRWSQGQVGDGDLLGLLSGASPISAELRSPEALALAAAVAADERARRLLRFGSLGDRIDDCSAAAALAELRALPGPVGERLREFLALREYRLVEGLDPASPCLRECPALLFQMVRAAAQARDGAEPTDRGLVARIRAAIPAEFHWEFEALLAEARLTAPLRDERSLFSDVWAWGIVRAAVLEIGRRVIARSSALLVQPQDLIHATSAEIEALLAGRPGPSATELEARATFWRAYTTADAPPELGPKSSGPPSPDQLPPGSARLGHAIAAVIEHVLAKVERRSSGQLSGFAASSGQWEGPVYRVNSHDDTRKLAPGSVLVVGTGSSTFSMIAPLASAVVAEGGGLLSHVAIVCREYRIPCVCGAAGALTKLKNGQRVRVDGTRGVVEVLA